LTAITSSLNMTNIVWGFNPHAGLEATTVSVTAVGAWTLTSTQPWIRLSQTSGTGNATVPVSIAPDVAFPSEAVGPFQRIRQGTYTATLTLTEGSNTATCAVTYAVGYGDQVGISNASPPPSPTISPNGGTFGVLQTVTLSTAVKGATIYYTIDGSEPSPQSPVYTGPFTTGSGAVQAIAVVDGLGWSPVALAVFTVTPPQPEVFQHANVAGSNTTTFTGTTSSFNSTAANFLIAVLHTHPLGGLPNATVTSSSVTDNLGNTWHPLTFNTFFGHTQYFIQMFYCFNPTTNASHTVTGTFNTIQTASLTSDLDIFGFNGILASSDPLIGQSTASSNGSSVSSLQTGTVATQNSALVFSFASSVSTPQNLSVNDGFDQTVGGLVSSGRGAAYVIASNSSGLNPTWSVSDSEDLGANIAAFQHA
jgi:hypothetical protein